MKNIKIPLSEDGSRFDRCLRRLLGYINQALLEKLLRSGLILLDNKKTKSSIKVKLGQIISYSNDINFEKKDIKNTFDKSTNFYKRDKRIYSPKQALWSCSTGRKFSEISYRWYVKICIQRDLFSKTSSQDR